MASAEAIDAAEGLLADSYEAAALWLAEGLVQIQENDRKRERGETPHPCPLELFRAGVRHYSDVVLMGAVESLLTSTPDVYRGNRNFLGLIRQHADPIHAREQAESHDAEVQARLPREAGQLALPGTAQADPPEHGDGRWVYATWTRRDGSTAEMRDTKRDNLDSFGALAGLMARTMGRRKPTDEERRKLPFPCPCGRRYATREAFERHAVVHYPPGARAYHERALGLSE